MDEKRRKKSKREGTVKETGKIKKNGGKRGPGEKTRE
jgi:hypothetical protein